jgi:hydroxymethylpyrimidine pyrophosphatase-like HAD family hydrolase
MEVGSPLASKMQGLQTLLQHLRLSFAQVIAVGDAENDVEILRAAGLGVAMANASGRVKAVADLVIKSNSEDGLAHFLNDKGESW